MRHKKLMAMALVAAMMTGTFAAGVPALAAGDNATTQINLTVADTNPTYELVVPAKLDVAASGYNAFTDGVTVKNLTNGSSVSSIDVTAKSEKSWNLMDSNNNKISYKLVAGDARDTEKTTYSFTDTSAMAATTGSTINCGVNVADYSSAAAGEYSDTITWTAEVEKATATTLEDVLKDGAVVNMQLEVYNEMLGTNITYDYEITNANGSFTATSTADRNVTVNATETGFQITKTNKSVEFNVDVKAKTYSASFANGSVTGLTSFKVNGTELVGSLQKN